MPGHDQTSPGITKAQVNEGVTFIGFNADQALTSPLAASYATYREMRKNPTIALGRAILTGPVAAGQWTVQSKNGVSDDLVEFVRDEFLSRRQSFMETVMYGQIDFGWQSFEKVFEFDADDGRIHLRKLKALLHDITQVLVDGNGGFIGLAQVRDHVTVPLEQSLLISFRVEGTQWYGQSLLENARHAYNAWIETDAGAARYATKISGSHWFIQHPFGSTIDETGATVENKDIAIKMLTALRSVGGGDIAVGKAADPGKQWDVELKGDPGGGAVTTFVPRNEYLDRQMIRGLLVPERAALEGRYGTRADAEAHADIAITGMELADRHITTILNWHCVDQLLAANFGEDARGSVWLESAPLVDTQRESLMKVYDAILRNPGGFLEEFGQIDTDAIKDKIGVPKSQEIAEAGTTPLDGVDADDPLSASIRGVYADGNGNGNPLRTRLR